VVTGVIWRGTTITVELSTPEPINVADRPVLTFLARAISGLFGGTTVGEHLLSGPLPQGARWNGRDASISFDVPNAMAARRAPPVAIDVSQDTLGLWLRFADEERQCALLVQVIATALVEILYGGR
jgi:hypothetical protein